METAMSVGTPEEQDPCHDHYKKMACLRAVADSVHDANNSTQL